VCPSNAVGWGQVPGPEREVICTPGLAVLSSALRWDAFSYSLP
jgi:hypothetical protein